MADTVQKRIAHLHICRAHIYFGTKNMFAVFKLTFFHSLQKVEILLYASLCVFASASRFRNGSAVFSHRLFV
jgi:hypothetical protein